MKQVSLSAAGCQRVNQKWTDQELTDILPFAWNQQRKTGGIDSVPPENASIKPPNRNEKIMLILECI